MMKNLRKKVIIHKNKKERRIQDWYFDKLIHLRVKFLKITIKLLFVNIMDC